MFDVFEKNTDVFISGLQYNTIPPFCIAKS